MSEAYFIRRTPPTTTLLVATLGMNSPAIVAVDDGVTWSATYFATLREAALSSGMATVNPALSGYPIPPLTWSKDQIRVKGTSLDTIEKAMLRWAKKVVSPANTKASVGSQREQLDMRTIQSPVVGTIRIDGWKALSKRSAHSLEVVEAMLLRSVEACFRAWGWKAEGLVLSFHSGRRSLGLAYAPGKKNRRISLNTVLFEKYDMGSIERTALHELCHHAREEHSSSGWVAGGHDGKFCEMLAMVDPTVANDRMSCRYFTDEADAGIVAAAEAKSGVVYAAASGVVHVSGVLKGRRYSLKWSWSPRKKGQWKAKGEFLTAVGFLAFLMKFPAGERRAIETIFDYRGTVTTQPMLEFVRIISERFSRAFGSDLAPAFVDAPAAPAVVAAEVAGTTSPGAAGAPSAPHKEPPAPSPPAPLPAPTRAPAAPPTPSPASPPAPRKIPTLYVDQDARGKLMYSLSLYGPGTPSELTPLWIATYLRNWTPAERDGLPVKALGRMTTMREFLAMLPANVRKLVKENL